MQRKRWAFAVLAFSILVTPQAAHAAVNCAQEISASTAATRSGYRLNRRLNQFVQTLKITNKGSSTMQGPLVAALTGLSANATLFNGAGTLPCSGVSAAAIEISAGPDNLFSPGESATVVLHFENPTMAGIQYGLRLFSSTLAVNPVQGITVNPDVVFINTATQVTFRAVTPYQGTAPTLTLVRVNQNGQVLGVEGTLVDNGDLEAGDEIPGDGSFSFRKTYNLPTVQDLSFKIQFAGVTSTTSAPFLLRFVSQLTGAQLSQIVSMQQALKTLYLNTPGGKAAGIAAVLAQLANQPNVLEFGVSEGSNSVWMLHAPGILGGLMLNPPGTRGGLGLSPPAGGIPSSSSSPRRAAAASGRFTTPARSSPVATSGAAITAADAIDEVGASKVLIASPFLFEFGAHDEGPNLRTLYETSTCPTFDVTYLPNALFTVEAARTMGRYGVVHLGTHGDTYYFGLPSIWQLKFGWEVPGSQVVFLTGQKATAANLSANQVDLAAGRLALIDGYYSFLPSFVTAYSGPMPNSLVFTSACRGTFNPTMSSAFLGRGAGTYLGFSEYVAASFAYDRAMYFHEKFVEDPTDLVTTGEIFIPGQSHPFSPPSFWQMAGSTTLELPDGKQLQNGDFELGALGAWTATGDGRVVAQLGGIFAPTEGDHAGLISTGLGFTTAAGSIDANICLPADSTTLTFDWNFTSEEFQEYCGDKFQDTFRVQLVTDNGVVTLFSKKIDDLCGSTFPVPFSFDEGDAWSTGWRSVSLNISAIAASNAGKPVRLVFSAVDVGDSIFDTAVMIDRIEIKK